MCGLTDHISNVRLFVVPDSGYWLLGYTEEVKLETTQFLHQSGDGKNSRTWPPATPQG
jgi:hypothetical protein